MGGGNAHTIFGERLPICGLPVNVKLAGLAIENPNFESMGRLNMVGYLAYGRHGVCLVAA
jgi:hypothetical protein